MKTKFLRWCAAFLLLVVPGVSRGAEKAEGIEWEPWSDAVLAQPKAERKIVLLDVVAVWSHRCHAMDEITYRDPAVRVDQGAPPASRVKWLDIREGPLPHDDPFPELPQAAAFVCAGGACSVPMTLPEKLA